MYPRLVELERLFSETGAHARDGRRLLLQRPSGFDLHSVRDYVEGDSLRKVHWRSTARRAHLMVKELEDSPREDVAVVLDAWHGCPRPVFDVAVRAAGSILQAYARRTRRAALVLGGATVEVQRVQAEGDWRRALELLAGAEPDGVDPPDRLLAGERNPAALALDLVVVTPRLDPAFADRVIQRANARRNTALVYVDGAHDREPLLLRLQAAGVAVAVLREGDDLVSCSARLRSRRLHVPDWRPALVALVPGIVVMQNWLRLEDPQRDGGRAVLILALAVVPALASRLWQRLVLLALAFLVTVDLAARVPLFIRGTPQVAPGTAFSTSTRCGCRSTPSSPGDAHPAPTCRLRLHRGAGARRRRHAVPS